MDKLNKFLLQEIFKHLSLFEQALVCSSNPEFVICLNIDTNILTETGYIRFDPRISQLITDTPLVLNDESINYELMAWKSEPFPFPGTKFRQVYDNYFLTLDGEVFSYHLYNRTWHPEVLNIHADQYPPEKYLNIVNVKLIRDHQIYIDYEGRTFSDKLIKIPFPIVEQVIDRIGESYFQPNLLISESGQLYDVKYQNVLSKPIPDEILKGSPIIKAVRKEGQTNFELIRLQKNGNLIWTNYHAPDVILAQDTSQNWVDINVSDTSDIYGLSRDGKLYQINYEDGQIYHTQIQTPQKAGQIAKFYVGIINPNSMVIINKFGQGYINPGNVGWNLIATKSFLFDIGKRVRFDIYAIGYVLNDYFQDAEQGKVSDYQKVDTDIYENTLINYTLTLPDDSQSSRWAWIDLVTDQNRPLRRAITHAYAIYYKDDDETQNEVQYVLQEAVRFGKVLDNPDKKGNYWFYFVNFQGKVVQIYAGEKDGQLIPHF